MLISQSQDHFNNFGYVFSNVTINSPKKLFAHANHSLVIALGLWTEYASCMRSCNALFSKLYKQFVI